ncbi:MAG: hypothetical protein HXK68_02535 [Clostridiales bacterium]|nr:hypothetical protein [Clostridiales bacterium]
MYFLGTRKASFLAYPKDGDDTGVSLPIAEDSKDSLVVDAFANPANKTSDLVIYPDQIGGSINLCFSFDHSQDFIALYASVRPLWDEDDEERPLVDIPVIFDPEESETSEIISLRLPNEPAMISIMIPDKLNLNHGRNTVRITKI